MKKGFKHVFTVTNAGYFFLFLAIITIIIGYISQNGSFNLLGLWNIMWANIGAEALSISITILIIDKLNNRRMSIAEKTKLIWEIQDAENSIANRAFQRLHKLGWLNVNSPSLECNFEGSELKDLRLHNANMNNFNLTQVNLENARISESTLINAKLYGAYMRASKLQFCNFRNADLRNADLSYSILRNADLRGADLTNANLTEAQLRYAVVDEKTILENITLPNGEKYDNGRIFIRKYRVKVLK